MKYMKSSIKHCSHCKCTDGDFLINARTAKHTTLMCRKCNTERASRYMQTKKGRENVYKAVYKSIEKHYNRQQARQKLNYAIKIGRITKPKTCSICKKKAKIQGHHEDYTKPLEVIWCCQSCHCVLDKKLSTVIVCK